MMGLSVLLLILQSFGYLSALSVNYSIYQYPMKAAVRVTFELNSSVLYNLTAKCLMTPEDSSNGKDQTSCGDTTRSKADGATHLPITYEPLKYGWRIFVVVDLSTFAKTEPNKLLDLLPDFFLSRMPPEPIFNISANTNSSRANLTDTVITVYLASNFSSRGRLDALTFSLVRPGESCCVNNRKTPAITRSWSPSDSGPHTLRLGITNHTSGQLYKVCALVSSFGTASPCVETEESVQQAPLPPKIKQKPHRNHIFGLEFTNITVVHNSTHLECELDEKKDVFPTPYCILEKHNHSHNEYSVETYPYGAVFILQSWSVIDRIRSFKNSTFLFYTDLPIPKNVMAEAEENSERPSVRFTWMKPVDIAYPYDFEVSCDDCSPKTVKFTEIKDNSSTLEFIFSDGLTHGRNFSLYIALHRGVRTKHSDTVTNVYSEKVHTTVAFGKRPPVKSSKTAALTLSLLTILILIVGLVCAYFYYVEKKGKNGTGSVRDNLAACLQDIRNFITKKISGKDNNKIAPATHRGTVLVRPTEPGNVSEQPADPAI